MFSKKPDNNKLNERTPLFFNTTESAKPILSSKSNDDPMQEVAKALEMDLELAQTLLNDLRGSQQSFSHVDNNVALALQNSAFLKKYNLYTLANTFKDLYNSSLNYASAHEDTAKESNQRLEKAMAKYVSGLEAVPETIAMMKQGLKAVNDNNRRNNTIR